MAISTIHYDAIMHNYDIRRAQAAAELEMRRDEIALNVPGVRTLDEKIAGASLAEARARLSGTPEDPAYAQTIQSLCADREQLLLGAGYPADYLELRYTCPDCRDTGFIGTKHCHCFNREVAGILSEQSGISAYLDTENFDHFCLDYYDADKEDPFVGRTPRALAQEALSVSRQFVEDFDSTYANLLFYGVPGVGKTFLTHCIAAELLNTTHTVLYMTAQELFKILAADRLSGQNTYAHLSESILQCDLLIIDDLGTELTNTLTVSELFTCLNERSLGRRSTIISTNLSLNEIKALYSERILSRIISEYTLVHLIGDDIRLTKKLRSM